jgi:hypothetical protein
VLAISDKLAAALVFLPWLITGYWALHIIGHPQLWPLLLALLVGLVWVSCKSEISISSRSAFGIGGSSLTAFLLALILVPALANAALLVKALAFHPLATHFISEDDAIYLLIARGLEHGFPPPDLSYSGESFQYHYGLPLLIEFMHRSSGLPPHAMLYGVLPGLLSLATVLSSIRILRLLFPDWTINRLFLGVLLSQAVILIDVYNLGWQIRDFLHSGSLAQLGSVPIATIYSTPVLTDVQEMVDAGMGIVLLLVLFANIDRCGPFATGCMLFAIYITKQQLFLPLAAAWGIVGLVAWARERDIRTLVGLGIATGLVGGFKFAVPFAAGYALQPAFNNYFIQFGRHTNPLAPTLLAVPAIALLVVLISVVLGTHIYGVALYTIYYRNRSKLLILGKRLVLLTGVYFVSGIALLVGTILIMKPAVQVRFDAIYETIGDQLWLRTKTYRADMMNLSLRTVLAPCGTLFSLFATGAVLQWHLTTLSRKWRAVLSALCILAVGLVGYRWTQLAAWNPPSSWHVIEDSEVQALRAAKDDPGTILTNDLRFQPGNRLWLPLANIGAPQLFGQQFYASNFMYGTYAYADALDRLHVHEWFWSTPFEEHHQRFLAQNDIKYLLIRRDMPFPQEILSMPWADVVLRNEKYYLVKLKSAQ